MKRRNVESGGKPRRNFKRFNKLSDGPSSFLGSFVYSKVFLIWLTILLADFILEFRFEYLWPLWLLVRSIGNCFKYQGMVAVVFFSCFTLVSDAVCFFLIPMHMLFFLASTYVWVRYLWNADRGICMPTVTLWLLFVLVEVLVRSKDFQKNSLPVDLCRPFAAHCVGYPIVALGSGFKNFVQYRMRLWKQNAVQRENEFLFQILLDALPKLKESNQEICGKDSMALAIKEDDGFGYSCGIMNSPCTKRTSRHNNVNLKPACLTETSSSNQLTGDVPSSGMKLRKRSSSTTLSYSSPAQPKSSTRKEQVSFQATAVKEVANIQPFKDDPSGSSENTAPKRPANAVSDLPDVLTPIYDKKLRSPNDSDTADTKSTNIKNDDVARIEKLESIVSELRSELNLSRQCEGTLRMQNFTLIDGQKNAKNELVQLRREREQLQSKLHNLVSMKQKDKQIMESLESQLRDETMAHQSTEKMLQDERTRRMAEETRTAVFVTNNREREKDEENKRCLDDLRKECNQLKEQLYENDELCGKQQKELEELRSKEKAARESETLMSALAAMQEKNAMLENSLSAETRLKLDLFSALGTAKRRLEISHNIRCRREMEIQELQARVADVLSVLPDSQTASTTPHYSTAFLENRAATQPSMHLNQPQHYSPAAYCPVPLAPVAQQNMDPHSIIRANALVQTSSIVGLHPGPTAYAPSPNNTSNMQN